jgi:hypothetical protein
MRLTGVVIEHTKLAASNGRHAIWIGALLASFIAACGNQGEELADSNDRMAFELVDNQQHRPVVIEDGVILQSVVTEEPCAPVPGEAVCVNTPSPYCDGETLVTYAFPGKCKT